MSNEKSFISEPHAGPASNADEIDTALAGARKPVAVVAFEIDDTDDPGGDPYNHTGSFCVPEFSDD